MKEPTVGRHKGQVNSRKQGTIGGSERVQKLIERYVTSHVAERRALVKEWTQLREAGVSRTVISEEYKVSISTLDNAYRDPDDWIHRPTSKVQRGLAVTKTRKRRRA